MTPQHHTLFDIVRGLPSNGVAVIHRGRETTVEELVERTDGWVTALERHVQPGEVVATDYTAEPAEYLSQFIAIMHVGGVHLPTRSPGTTYRRLNQLARPWHAICAMPQSLPHPGCQIAIFDGSRRLVHSSERDNSSARDHCPGHAPGRILETSGSTGTPKWVYWTQDDLLADREEWITHLGLESTDVILNRHALDFAHGIDVHALPALCVGAPLVHCEGEPVDSILDLLIRHRVTMMSALPSHYAALAHANRSVVSFGHLRLALTGGAQLAPATVQLVEDRTGIMLKRLYGATEAGIMCANLTSATQTDAALAPMPGVTMEFDPIPGLPAHLYPKFAEPRFRRAHMATEYWGDAERTAAAFTASGYRSGDAVEINPDGSIGVLGRADDVWTTPAGELQSSGELIARLQTVTDVKEVAVLPVRNATKDTALTIFCSLTDNARITEVKKCVAALLEGVEHTLYLVSDWPRTIVGKPDRRALLAWATSA